TLTKEELRQLYDKDFPLWVEVNLELLKDKAYDMVDWDNLLEEIKDMGRSDLKACISYLAVILAHIYKLENLKKYTKAGEQEGGYGWIKSIKNSRRQIETMLKHSPSLKIKLPLEIDKAWDYAVNIIISDLEDMGLEHLIPTIPKDCPYSYEEAMNKEV
ncbi:MAG: DUF29 domain-containing protein, partial [Hydrogenothermaceae bacterium]|nr:DUF29 domain-containing protein [Hydrogenothermaceae bacterium]